MLFLADSLGATTGAEVRYPNLSQDHVLARAVAGYVVLTLHREDVVGAQLSGYKFKNDNWLHVDSTDIPDIAEERAWETSIFSKRLTLRICRIV
jgi:hypothetical protein